MQTRIQQWGNSLGLRIPKALAEQASVEVGSTVDVTVEGEHLIVRLAEPRFNLDELLTGVLPSNIHDAAEFGEPVGREVW